MYIAYERVIEGELPESDFSIVVEEIRRFMENVGQVSQIGNSFSWTMARGHRGGRDVEVSVTVRGGRTRITARESLRDLAGISFGALGAALTGIGMSPIIALMNNAVHRPGALLVVLPAWLITTFSSARTAFYYGSRQRQRKLEGLVARTAEIIGELINDSRRLP